MYLCRYRQLFDKRCLRVKRVPGKPVQANRLQLRLCFASHQNNRTVFTQSHRVLNAIEFGIRLQREVDEGVRNALLQALATDPYFEVRAAAARELGERFGPCDRIEEALLQTLSSDRAPRVIIQAIRGLGRAGRGPRVLDCFRTFYLHFDWQFRQEVVTALKQLLERGVIDPATAAGEVEKVLDASPGFEPAFPLKESLRELAEQARVAIDDEERKKRPAGGHA